jgi:hypothetical protein
VHDCSGQGFSALLNPSRLPPLSTKYTRHVALLYVGRILSGSSLAGSPGSYWFTLPSVFVVLFVT